MRPVHDRIEDTDEALLARIARGDRERLRRILFTRMRRR